MAKKQRSITIGDGSCCIETLKNALSKCKDTSQYTIKLCFDENKDEHCETETLLRQECGKLYLVLVDALKCIEICAKEEKRLDDNIIYYDTGHAHNVGARGLLEDVNMLLDNHHKFLVELDISQ